MHGEKMFWSCFADDELRASLMCEHMTVHVVIVQARPAAVRAGARAGPTAVRAWSLPSIRIVFEEV